MGFTKSQGDVVYVTTVLTSAIREPDAISHVSKIDRTQLTNDLFAQAGLEEAEQRETTLRRIVVLHVPTARSIARQYRHRGIELEDLEQTACIALLRAVRGFDPALGHGFLAYAVPTIRGAVRRHFRDYGWMVRPPRTVQELQPKVGAFAFERDPDSGRPLTVEQVAERLGTTVQAVREAAQASGCFMPTSLDAPTGSAAPGVLGERLPARGDPGFEAAEARAALGSVLPKLRRPDRLLLQMRFVDDRTQQDMADELGLTQSQVSRRLAQILAELRNLLIGQGDEVSLAG